MSVLKEKDALYVPGVCTGIYGKDTGYIQPETGECGVALLQSQIKHCSAHLHLIYTVSVFLWLK